MAPEPVMSRGDPETRMTRASGYFAMMLRQAVAPFNFGIW